MPTLIMRPAGRSFQLHQENSGHATTARWPGWLGLWARQWQRAVLRELADDPHRLNDLGLTREQAGLRADASSTCGKAAVSTTLPGRSIAASVRELRW